MSVLKIKDQNNNWTQIPTIKGDKGDPFTYADFTPEQLESLKGKDGISPTVSVASDTSEDYRLSFTDETHTVTTPNLIPEAEKIFDVYPTDTASGSIASFPDGADNVPLKSCIVRVEPVQDLHGQDSPYPAGGGKNKFQTTAETRTVNGTTFTVNDDGTVTVVGTPTANINGGYSFGEVTLPAGNYKLNGNSNPNSDLRLTCYNVTASSVIASIYNNNDLSFTLSDASVIRLYPFVSTSFSGSAITMKPMIRLASESDATFAPYENICPITGWTGCEVQRTGKNLFDKSDTSKQMSNVYIGNNKLVYGTSRCVCFVPCKPNTSYVFSREAVETSERFAVGYTEEYPSIGVDVYGVKSVTPSQTIGNIMSLTLTTGANAKYLVVWAYWDNTSEALDTLQIDIGSTATDYEPYTGQTYPITFPSEAGTVYGGYIDPINGEMVVDRAMVDMGTLAWTKSSDRGGYFWVDFPLRKINSVLISSIYPYNGTRPAIYTSASVGLYQETMTIDKYVDIYDPAYSNVAEIVSALNGQQLVYELAEPIHYPLTAIDIKTLLGQNNLWADTGDVSVEYRADTRLYIKRLTDSDTDMIADANITSGSYFMVGNNLYRATANIASGASVIVGTNAVKVSLAQALNEIKEA